ncbi:caspase family protein [Actinosynnema sp. NPDC051121]
MDRVRALLIGCDTYDDPGLPDLDTCINDAQGIAAHLQSIATSLAYLEVKVLRSPSRSEVSEALEWLYRSKDLALNLLFLSGHGYRSPNGRTSFACRDSSPARLESMVSSDHLYEMASWSPAFSPHLWIFDFCFSEGLILGATSSSLSMLDLTALASSAADKAVPVGTHAFRSVATPFSSMSFFSRSVLLALRGVGATALLSEKASLADIGDLVVMESLRVGAPIPATVRRGPGGGPHIPFLESPQPQSFGPILFRPPSDKGPASFVVGTDGVRSLAIASSMSKHGRVAIADGRSPTQLDISVRLFSQSSQKMPMIFEGVAESEVLENVGRLLAGREDAAAIVSPSLQLPEDTEFSVIAVSPVSETEVVDWIRRYESFEDFGRREEDGAVLEYALRNSGDSIEVASALIARRRSAGFGAENVDQLEIPFAEEGAGAISRAILSFLLVAPGVFMPLKSILDSATRITGAPAARVTDSITELRRKMLVEVVGQWCRITAPVAGLLPPDWKSEGESGFFSYALQHLDHMRDMGRLQILRAISSITHSGIRRKSVSDDLVALLSHAGFDLTQVAGAHAFARIASSVTEIRNGDVPAKLAVYHGHALRLADRYDDASNVLRKAEKLATTDADRLSVAVGRVAALKNAVERREELMSLRESLSSLYSSDARHVDPASSREVANSYFQQANVSFSSSLWDESESKYNRALSYLDVDQPQHHSLIVDVLKGLGDISLLQDRRNVSISLATAMLDVCGYGALPLLEPKCHAKAMQYVGDLHRRLTLSASSSSLDRKHHRSAEMWLNKALILYRSNGLQLGEYMSAFKLAQCAALEGRLEHAVGVFSQATSGFEALNNPLWQYRSSVQSLLAIGLLGRLDTRVGRSMLEAVRERASNGSLSPYHIAWGKLAVSVASNGPIASSVGAFEDLEMSHLSVRLSRDGVGVWLFSFY